MTVSFATPLRAVEQLDVTADTLTARLYIDPEHPILRGHFPGLPLYPGVFIVETLCQAMAQAFPTQSRLLSVRSLRLTAPLHGGDELTLTVKLTPLDGGWNARGTGRRRDGAAAASIWAVFGGA
ncbi:hotdog family protein [Catelliglobosispora koreensis]|uniref:hypothetical protein n=1 Tax=Catelliglobosispora koreensis TaxID=129052 RepID=UPI00036C4E77|nr:hypothetical protein [Catelliglobosispora koreensis]